MKYKVVGLGPGGHAKVILDILRHYPQYEIAGFTVAPQNTQREKFCEIPILGTDHDLPKIWKDGIRHAFIGVGSTRSSPLRSQLFQSAKQVGFELIRIIHPGAVVAPSVRLGEGNIIMAGVVINPDVILGDNVIVNTGAIIEHDCRIGNHGHISPGARLAGGVRTGEGVHVGLGASVLQECRIGNGSTVGAGAVVVEDVPPEVTVVGVPARLQQRGRSSSIGAAAGEVRGG